MGFQLHLCWNFWYCSIVLECSTQFFLNSFVFPCLSFTLSNFYWPIFWFTDPFLTIFILLMSLQRHSLSLSVSFTLLIIPLDSVLQFPWLLKLSTWYYMLSFFSTRSFKTLVILHPLFDTNNTCIVSEASADEHFLLWCFACFYKCHFFLLLLKAGHLV